VERLSFRERAHQVPVQFAQPRVRVIVQRVELAARRLQTVIPPRVFAQTDDHVPVAGFLAPLPSVTRVRRGVDFHDDSHSPDQRVPQQIFDISVRIYFLGTVRAVSEMNALKQKQKNQYTL